MSGTSESCSVPKSGLKHAGEPSTARLLLPDSGGRAQKKDKDRSKGKGRRCCLGGQNLFNFFRTGCLPRMILIIELHQDDLKEKDEFILFFKIKILFYVVDSNQ